ncbi:MAG: DNA repair protein RecO [Clostridia bacterium]|jgi:DNA repair protein RecO (recombination protein O)
MSYIKTKGIVVRQVNTGEADKIVTIFSKDLGKISCSAKGARRPRSSYVAATQLLCYSDFVLFKGRDMYSINSCDVIESFYDIRNDIARLTYASHMSEIINDVIMEGQPSKRVLQLFLNSLHMLSNTDKSAELIIRIFEIRLLSILGYAPGINGCSACGSTDDETFYFSFRKSGFICENCLNSDENAVKISKGVVKALNYIIYSKIEDVFSFNLSEDVLKGLSDISKRYLSETLEKDYSKLDFLKNL